MADLKSLLDARMNQWDETVNAGKIDEAVQLYTPDAKAYYPGVGPIDGREGLRKFHQGIKDIGVTGSKMMESEVFPMGDEYAFFYGVWQWNDSKTSTTDTGKSISVFKKVDGVWLVHREIMNQPGY